jgi:hypothetical protein
LTDRANACGFATWTEGATLQNVPVIITQSGDAITVEVQGIAGTALSLVTGSAVFSGSVTDSDLDAGITGTKSADNGSGCAYTLDAEIKATLSGNTLNGQVHYRPRTNNAPSCGVLASCDNIQDFAGARPPK